MADITKDTYSEAKRYGKVVFQRDKDITDFELNELQDDIRVPRSREGLEARMDGVSAPVALRAIGSALSNDITITAGTLFLNVQTYRLLSDTLLTVLGVTLITPGAANIEEYSDLHVPVA